jgi:hypothetical protein
MSILIQSFQFIVALGLINVWVVRNSQATAYRGGQAKNLKDEFREYGLPDWVYYVVGFLKLSSALVLMASFWWPALRLYPSMIVLALMLGAVTMHIKVKDPFKKSVPALFMLFMSSCLVLFSLS